MDSVSYRTQAFIPYSTENEKTDDPEAVHQKNFKIPAKTFQPQTLTNQKQINPRVCAPNLQVTLSNFVSNIDNKGRDIDNKGRDYNIFCATNWL